MLILVEAVGPIHVDSIQRVERQIPSFYPGTEHRSCCIDRDLATVKDICIVVSLYY
jgi:hypothetical protein